MVAALPDGEQLYFDKYALSMTLPGFQGLLHSESFQKFLRDCNSLFQAQLEGKPLLIPDEESVPEASNAENSKTSGKGRTKKARVLESENESEEEDINDYIAGSPINSEEDSAVTGSQDSKKRRKH